LTLPLTPVVLIFWLLLERKLFVEGPGQARK
jgi:hypothetical protein